MFVCIPRLINPQIILSSFELFGLELLLGKRDRLNQWVGEETPRSWYHIQAFEWTHLESKKTICIFAVDTVYEVNRPKCPATEREYNEISSHTQNVLALKIQAV